MLSESLLSRDVYISEILDQEQPPANEICPKCLSKRGLLRCEDCFSRQMLCLDCCLATHQNTPFHSIQKWTGHFFQATSLNEEGFTLNLGHSGAPCPELQLGISSQGTQAGGVVDEGSGDERTPLGSRQADAKKRLVIVDVSGIHQLHIGWCRCKEAPGADIQLLRNRLFPASTANPSTAFTFKLLHYFHIDSVECKTSALSFFSKLRRLTNESSPDSVPVSLIVYYPSGHCSNCTQDRYRELMRVSRTWRDISARIQAGYGHHLNEPVTPGGLAIFCPACPQPGVNLPDDWREDVQK